MHRISWTHVVFYFFASDPPEVFVHTSPFTLFATSNVRHTVL
jgi:hypothetical protein